MSPNFRLIIKRKYNLPVALWGFWTSKRIKIAIKIAHSLSSLSLWTSSEGHSVPCITKFTFKSAMSLKNGLIKLLSLANFIMGIMLYKTNRHYRLGLKKSFTPLVQKKKTQREPRNRIRGPGWGAGECGWGLLLVLTRCSGMCHKGPMSPLIGYPTNNLVSRVVIQFC